MSQGSRLDNMSMRIRARLSKPRPVRRGKKRAVRAKTNPHTIVRELRHIAGLRPHHQIDVTQATFLYGTVLGHALGSRAITQAEYMQMVNNPD